jgi:cytoskeleton protein RodZ
VEPVEDIAQPAPLGELLSRERERLGLSRGEIAQRLHMSASQVEALEVGDYDHLPKGPFLRGFVRNYAKQLGLAPEPLLSRLQQVAPRPPSPGIIVPSQNIRFDPLGQRLSNPYVKASVIALVVVAIAFAAMYWWLFVRPTPPAAAARKPVELGPPQQLAAAPVSAAETPAPVDAPKTEMPLAEKQNGNAAATSPSPALPQGGGSSAAPAASLSPALPQGGGRAAAPAAATAGERVIRLRFKGESWVEIKDGRGRTLLSRINAPGSEAEVVGRPPFELVVGNAPEVQMFYDNREFALEPHTRVAVARFTVE